MADMTDAQRIADGRGLYWVSGFAMCGAIKVAFEGDWVAVVLLLGAVALCELAAWDIRRKIITGE